MGDAGSGRHGRIDDHLDKASSTAAGDVMSVDSDFAPIAAKARAASPLAASAPRSASNPAAGGGWVFTFFDTEGTALVRVLVNAAGTSAEVVE